MPTEYTSILSEDNVSLRDFILRCARAFGAFAEMREKPLDVRIPDNFKPDPYHKKALNEARLRLKKAESMSLDEAEKISFREYENNTRRNLNYRLENRKLEEKYSFMLQQVRNWEPPSRAHIELKNFMISQLEESLKFDCSYVLEDVKKLNGREYKVSLITSLKKDIKYHSKKWKEELKRNNEGNKWIKELFNSLPSK